jgi:hypothetical protein
VDGDGVAGLVEEDAVIADAEPEESVERAAEWFDSALAAFGVVVDGFQTVQCGLLLDGADFFLDVGLKADFFNAAFSRPYGRGPGPW